MLFKRAKPKTNTFFCKHIACKMGETDNLKTHNKDATLCNRPKLKPP